MRNCTEFSQLKNEYLHMTKKRIGLLGGSFNPVHMGHIRMAYIALYEFLLGEVVFLPLGTPPHKPDAIMADAADRLEMVRLAIADEKRFCLSTLETERSGYTYTVDTLELLSRSRVDAAFYYIIGGDTVFELESWKKYRRVFMLTDFICILRPGHDDASVRRCADRLAVRYGAKIHIARERGSDISSSRIRDLIASNRLCPGLVPDKVAQYIAQHRIYSKEDVHA